MDSAATAETAALAMMYMAGTAGLPVISISQVATAGAVPPAIPRVVLYAAETAEQRTWRGKISQIAMGLTAV